MGLFKKALFAAPYCNIPAGNPQGVVAPLAPVLRAGMAQGRISAYRSAPMPQARLKILIER